MQYDVNQCIFQHIEQRIYSLLHTNTLRVRLPRVAVAREVMSKTSITALLSCIVLLAGTMSMRASANSAIPETTAAAVDEPLMPSPRDEALTAEEYRALVTDLESSAGAYASQLPESLFSLGVSLQSEGEHRAAIAAFKRGVHLARINDGLYCEQQVPMLQREIASHLALGQYAEADERQSYLYRVQMRAVENGKARAQAFMQQAHWQYTAYRLDLDGQGFARLMSMWDLYRLALNDIAGREGQASPALLEPLEGMLLAQYLIADQEPQGINGYQANIDNFSMQQQMNRFNAYRGQSYKKGQAVIQAIYDIQRAEHGEHSLETAQARRMLGDWKLWHGERESAMRAYREAIAELTPRDDAEEMIGTLFGKPVPLPDVAGASQLPPEADAGENSLQLRFTVNQRGKVEELERVDDNELDDAAANRLMRTLRKTPFRPRFALGEPQVTEAVTRSYAIQP